MSIHAPTDSALLPTRSNTPPPEEFTWRVNRLIRAMAEEDLDELLMYGWPWRPDNVRYLTGAPTIGTSLVRLRSDGSVAALVSSETDRAAILRGGWVSDVTRVRSFTGHHLQGLFDGVRPGSKIGITHLEILPLGLRGLIDEALSAPRLVSATRLADLIRLQKSSWERDRIMHGARVAQDGWNAMLDSLVPGVREFEVVAAVEREIKRAGAEDNFMLIAFGTTEVRAMHAPEARRLRRGDLVRTELTPQVDGYYTQICRTAVLGNPSPAQSRAYEIFQEALEAGISAVRPGTTSHDLAKAQNDVLRRNGLGEYCTPQHTRVRGHGLGMHPDEAPGIQEGDETEIPEGATLVIHPNTFTPTAGYIVVGDPVIVTASGSERLTKADLILPSRTAVTA
jgi:Xaa-Pro dipeptidase